MPFGKLFSSRQSSSSPNPNKAPIQSQRFSPPKFKSNQTAKKETPKPAPEKKSVFAPGKTYRSFLNIREFARKAPYKNIPTYNTKLDKKQREQYAKELQFYAKKHLGRSHGVSDRDYDIIVKKMEKEKMYTKNFAVKKELDKKIKVFKDWKKGY
ncbi:MAG: hypothetical protein ABH800_00275 [Candidatus Nealsonbacteria bacterium]